jgi:hypothetical protein
MSLPSWVIKYYWLRCYITFDEFMAFSKEDREEFLKYFKQVEFNDNKTVARIELKQQ